ncbi:MAG: pyridoxal phosphate-dependent aminotransferase family protein [Cyclobacteriaceae bacterium]|nr:pyridoxal phosphate-dependent aminotransferase family protein [Cyclobacteriaceae bacterium]MCH8515813.1 pyridoxal phosphate-dependent aminotransferase family protein [Cyclobacteriaceae bacterium]
MLNEKIEQRYQDRMGVLQNKGLDRELRAYPKGAIDFLSNDYLGLARSKELAQQIQIALYQLDDQVYGSGGSRLLAGHHDYIEVLECELAEFYQVDSVLTYASGYMANLGLLNCLADRGDTYLYDELSHVCMKEGMRLSKAQKQYAFRHNDLNDLEEKLKKASGQVFVAVESVYSMDGDLAPLQNLVKLCAHYQAILVVDEAHSTGISGSHGEGMAAAYDHQCEMIRVHTFGKAMGCHGALVTTTPSLKQYLISRSRSFIYTTAPPLHQWVAVREAHQFLKKHYASLSADLFAVIDTLNQMQLNEDWLASKAESPIVALIPRKKEILKGLTERAASNNIMLRPIFPPTVAPGTERIRMSLHAYNSAEEVRQVLSWLGALQ